MKVAFDIDGTLWKIEKLQKHHHDFNKDVVAMCACGHEIKAVPNYELIAVLKWFYNNGDQVFVWSAGGMDYAQTIVNKLGLSNMVMVIPKNGEWLKELKGPLAKEEPMDIAFDDCETKLAKVDVLVKNEI